MDDERRESLDRTIQLLLEALELSDNQTVKTVLRDTRVEDIAEIIESLNREEKSRIIPLVDQDILPDLFSRLDPDTINMAIEEFGQEFVATVLDKLPSEEAAEILTDMHERQGEEIIELMKQSGSAKVKKILEYPEDSAGRLMSTDLVALNENTSPEKAIEYIRLKRLEKPVYYIYVVDNDNKFIGIVPIPKILFAPPDCTIFDLIEKDFVTVSVNTDQEEVAKLVGKYDIPAMPVLDTEGHLVGRITVDDVLDVIEEEATEDIYRMAGTDYEELYSESPVAIARIRMPWLLTCIFGSILTGAVIHQFEITLAEQIALVAFIPVIMSTGGNTGLQSCTIMVRRMALGDISAYTILSDIWKEIRTAVVLGIACGLLLTVVAKLWRGNTYIAMILGVSMFFAVSVSSLVGMFVPLLFKKIKIDPAVASGPLITTLNDMVGLSIYLCLSTLFLSRIPPQ
ncbi:MAG: magnesium transporter [Candidatus Auribacterota bacterium]|jgi:magnesium transporter|nr:magnesium transporter [Candidatus Auribacterota bacterium]